MYAKREMDRPVHTDGIQVTLENKDLWKKFNDIGTEMIITKLGRRMFPFLELSIKGLHPQERYMVLLDMYPIGDKKYKYNDREGRWNVAESSYHVLPHPVGVYIHPEGPFLGSQLENPIKFHKVKLTNNNCRTKFNGHILLESMCRYVPRVSVMTVADFSLKTTDNTFIFYFRETEFIAVTAYMNRQITKLKIDYNPFATGFRHDGQNGRELDKEKDFPEVTDENDSDDRSTDHVDSQDECPDSVNETHAQSVGSAVCPVSTEQEISTQSDNVLYSVSTDEVSGNTIQVLHVNPSSIVVTDVPPSPQPQSDSPKSSISSSSILNSESEEEGSLPVGKPPHNKPPLSSTGSSSIPTGFIALEFIGRSQGMTNYDAQQKQVNMKAIDQPLTNLEDFDKSIKTQDNMKVINTESIENQVNMKFNKTEPGGNQVNMTITNQSIQSQVSMKVLDESICLVTNVRSIRDPTDQRVNFNDKQINQESDGPVINEVKRINVNIPTSCTESNMECTPNSQGSKSTQIDGSSTSGEKTFENDSFSRENDGESTESVKNDVAQLGGTCVVKTDSIKETGTDSTVRVPGKEDKRIQDGQVCAETSLEAATQKQIFNNELISTRDEKMCQNRDLSKSETGLSIKAPKQPSMNRCDDINKNKCEKLYSALSNEPDKENIQTSNTQISKLLNFVNSHPMNYFPEFKGENIPKQTFKRSVGSESITTTKKLKAINESLETGQLGNDLLFGKEETTVIQSNEAFINQPNAISKTAVNLPKTDLTPVSQSNTITMTTDFENSCSASASLSTASSTNTNQLNESLKIMLHPENPASVDSLTKYLLVTPEREKATNTLPSNQTPDRDVPKDIIITRFKKAGTQKSDVELLKCSEKLDYDIVEENKSFDKSKGNHGNKVLRHSKRKIRSGQIQRRRHLSNTFSIRKGFISKTSKPVLKSNPVCLSASDVQKAIINVDSKITRRESLPSKSGQLSTTPSMAGTSTTVTPNLSTPQKPHSEHQTSSSQSSKPAELRRSATVSSPMAGTYSSITVTTTSVTSNLSKAQGHESKHHSLSPKISRPSHEQRRLASGSPPMTGNSSSVASLSEQQKLFHHESSSFQSSQASHEWKQLGATSLALTVNSSSDAAHFSKQQPSNPNLTTDAMGKNIMSSVDPQEATNNVSEHHYPVILQAFSLRTGQATSTVPQKTKKKQFDNNNNEIYWGCQKILPKYSEAVFLQDKSSSIFLREQSKRAEIYNSSQLVNNNSSVPVDSGLQVYNATCHSSEYNEAYPIYPISNQHEGFSFPNSKEEIRLETFKTFSSQFSRNRAPDPRLPEIYYPTRTTFTCYSYHLVTSALPIIPQYGYSNQAKPVSRFAATHVNFQPRFDTSAV